MKTFGPWCTNDPVQMNEFRHIVLMIVLVAKMPPKYVWFRAMIALVYHNRTRILMLQE
jgi:hypothetical protein